MKILKRIGIVLIAVIMLAVLYFVYGLYINPKSPKGAARYENGDTEISIHYYRPLKRDRLIFGSQEDGALVPYGAYWRLGANLITRIKTNKNLALANRELDAGTYGLYTYPYKDHWVLVVHENFRGFSAAEPDPSGVLMKINITTQTLEEPLERFTIYFKEQNIRMRWDTTQVLIPFSE